MLTVLGTVLADTVMPTSGRDQTAPFTDIMAARLLNINILTGLHGPNACQGMPVVGRGDGDDVKGRIVKGPSHISNELWFAALSFTDRVGLRLAELLVRIADVEYLRDWIIEERFTVNFALAVNSQHGNSQLFVGRSRIDFVLGRSRRRHCGT